MKFMKFLFLSGVAVCIDGCSPILVNYDYDEKVDFSQLKTYD
jgi:hypothetical protein